MTPKELLKKKRHSILCGMQDARENAAIRYLKKNTTVVPIKVEEASFCREPQMVAIHCPFLGCGNCNLCDHMVTYSLKDKVVFCMHDPIDELTGATLPKGTAKKKTTSKRRT